jgi:hypothetical protein
MYGFSEELCSFAETVHGIVELEVFKKGSVLRFRWAYYADCICRR